MLFQKYFRGLHVCCTHHTRAALPIKSIFVLAHKLVTSSDEQVKNDEKHLVSVHLFAAAFDAWIKLMTSC